MIELRYLQRADKSLLQQRTKTKWLDGTTAKNGCYGWSDWEAVPIALLDPIPPTETLEFGSNTNDEIKSRELLDTPILEAATEIKAIATIMMVELRMPNSGIDINYALNKILNLSIAIKRQARATASPIEEPTS
tara:strand:- start:589 stop:990 length:402 start_codon:yes stop_codon:yes gene_type:complete